MKEKTKKIKKLMITKMKDEKIKMKKMKIKITTNEE